MSLSLQTIPASSPVTNNAEYNTYIPLAPVAPVAQVAPQAPVQQPYTTQLANGTTVQGAPSPAAAAASNGIYANAVTTGLTASSGSGSAAAAATQSPTNQAATGSTTTAATPSVLDQLAPILAALSTGSNVGAAGSGSGVGADDTSLPSPTTADVAALQPTDAPTSSSGPSTILIIGLVAVAGLGIYLYIKHKKDTS